MAPKLFLIPIVGIGKAKEEKAGSLGRYELDMRTGGINLSSKKNHKLFWIFYGAGIALIMQVIYDFFGEPLFTEIMAKQWWGFGMVAVILWILIVWTWKDLSEKKKP